MKRLVIYIFILFSFGFIFIEKSNAKGVLQYCKAIKYYQWTVVFVQEHEFESYCTKVYKNKNPVLYEGIKKRIVKGQTNNGTKHLKIINTKSLVRLIEQSKAFDNTLNEKKIVEEKKKIENEKKKIEEEKKRIALSASLAEELKKLKKLLDSGVITKEEFKKAKEKLLN